MSRPGPGARCGGAARRRLLLLGLAAAVPAWACRHPEPVATSRDGPVVLISIDTLRADHLPLYGYSAGSTPNLDRLGQAGIVFEDVYSHCPLTLPAHASLLTGLIPPHHGVRDNLGFTLKPDRPTLAERFKAAGFRTGAAISAYVLRHQTGIALGFDRFDDDLEIEGGHENLGELQRDGSLSVDALGRFVGSQPDGKFFAFLHLYEPHSPYAPPERHSHYALPYDGDIAYADELVGRFLESLRTKGLADKALLVVTSDHGEGLKQHGEAEHGILLYDEAVHVPLIVRLPGGARGGTRVAGTVAQVDIAATLLDLAGLSAAGLDGASLRPALATGILSPRRAYSETLFPRYHLGWSELFAATEGRYRYIQAPRPELYDRSLDSGETRSLTESKASMAAGMADWLTHTVGSVPPAAPEPVTSEEREKLQALGYIGSAPAPTERGPLPDPKDRISSYEDLRRAFSLRAAGKDAEAVSQLRSVLATNPAMIDAWETLGTTLVRLGKPREGVGALEQALKLDPGRAQTHLAMVRACVADHQIPLALQHAEIAAARDPAEGYELLAELMLDQRQLGPATEFARKSLAADAQRMMSHFVLGVVAQRAGRYQEALASFERAEELRLQVKKTKIRTLHANMGDCLARLGREAEAEREFQTEIEQMPASREGRVGLAMLYRSQGRDAEARQVLAGLIAADPRPGPEAYETVVRTLRLLGDVSAAGEWAARARAQFPSDPRFR